jgi:hypothetical protein
MVGGSMEEHLKFVKLGITQTKAIQRYING